VRLREAKNACERYLSNEVELYHLRRCLHSWKRSIIMTIIRMVLPLLKTRRLVLSITVAVVILGSVWPYSLAPLWQVTVLDKDNGEPVPNVEVTEYWVHNGFQSETRTTDRSGRAIFLPRQIRPGLWFKVYAPINRHRKLGSDEPYLGHVPCVKMSDSTYTADAMHCSDIGLSKPEFSTIRVFRRATEDATQNSH